MLVCFLWFKMPARKRIFKHSPKKPLKRATPNFRQRLTEQSGKPVYVKPPKIRELEKIHGKKLVEKARKELEKEFMEKTAVEIPIKKMIRVQPELGIEVDPRIKDKTGITRNGTGNIIINVGHKERTETKKPVQKEEKPKVELPEKSFFSERYNLKDSPEEKARHLIEAIKGEIARSQKGLAGITTHTKEFGGNLNPVKRMKQHIKFLVRHPAMTTKKAVGNVLHPRSAFAKSVLYQYGTYRGLKREARLTRKQHESLVKLGERTLLLINQAMKNYYFLRKKNEKTALDFIQQRLTKIKHDYEDQRNHLIHGIEKHGVFGKRYEKHRIQRGERTKAWGGL